MMFQRISIVSVVVLVVVIGNATAWSQKKPKATTESSVRWKASVIPVPKEADSIEVAQESKPKPRYAGHSGQSYILEEDEGHEGPEGEFVSEEDQEEHNGQEQERGYLNEDKKVDDETQKDFKQTGSYQDFSQGGAVFDKHHKDRVAENKENEDVKEHDAGEKFGAEAVKEHKLGRHKEKSKGHKKHGFKNVYHKEEYGDHKTFHDEFLDNDHIHDYDDQHEHRQMQGGRFSKGYKREGDHKEHDVGDEKHAWGKGGHDGNAEGYYEKGGHLSGHKQGHKKKEGYHDSNSRYGKHAAHKLKKGQAPEVSSHYHQGHDQPQYYSSVHHDNQAYSHYQDPDSEHHYDSQHARHNGGQHGQDVVPRAHTVKRFPQEEILKYHEQRTPTDARRLEVPVEERQIVNEPINVQYPLKDIQAHRENVQVIVDPKPHSFQYSNPAINVNVQSVPKEDRISAYRKHLGLSEPRRPHHHHFSLLPPLKQNTPVHYSQQNHPTVSQQVPRSHHVERKPFHHRNREFNHRHTLVRPSGQPETRSYLQRPSKPYPWWEHSVNAKSHQPSADSQRSPSHHHFGYVVAPEHYPGSTTGEESQQAASHHHPKYMKSPDSFHRHHSKKHHHHH